MPLATRDGNNINQPKKRAANTSIQTHTLNKTNGTRKKRNETFSTNIEREEKSQKKNEKKKIEKCV